MGEPRSLRPTVLRWLMHTCIIFSRAFIPLWWLHQQYCLFAWKHKWYALIPYSFIVELGIVFMNAGKMGPIMASDASLWLHNRGRWWRSQTGRKRAIKGHLLSSVNSKNRNGKHFLLWLAIVHLGLQIRLATRTHVSGPPHFLITGALPVSFTKPSTLFPETICQLINFVFVLYRISKLSSNEIFQK